MYISYLHNLLYHHALLLSTQPSLPSCTSLIYTTFFTIMYFSYLHKHSNLKLKSCYIIYKYILPLLHYTIVAFLMQAFQFNTVFIASTLFTSLLQTSNPFTFYSLLQTSNPFTFYSLLQTSNPFTFFTHLCIFQTYLHYSPSLYKLEIQFLSLQTKKSPIKFGDLFIHTSYSI